MAELLVKAVDASHPDPVKDARGCYKTGDPVVVMPDGHPWGAEEGLPKFWIIKIPSVTVAQVLKFIAHHTADGITVLRRRRYWLDRTGLTATLRNTLNSTGTVTLTRNQLQGALKDKVTGQTVVI